jgi:hypothetical protein
LKTSGGHAYAIEPGQAIKIFFGIEGENTVTLEGNLAVPFLSVIVDESQTAGRNAAPNGGVLI